MDVFAGMDINFHSCISSNMGTSRGHQTLHPTSRGHQTPTLAPRPSSPRGKAITFNVLPNIG